jgi:hypothetical protein
MCSGCTEYCEDCQNIDNEPVAFHKHGLCIQEHLKICNPKSRAERRVKETKTKLKSKKKQLKEIRNDIVQLEKQLQIEETKTEEEIESSKELGAESNKEPATKKQRID